MAHHDEVGMHGVERHRGVDQRLALADRATTTTDMFITSAPSRLPASSNEAWVRVEASKNRLIRVRPRSEARLLLDLAVELDEFLGEVEQADDVVARKPFDPQQMAAG